MVLPNDRHPPDGRLPSGCQPVEVDAAGHLDSPVVVPGPGHAVPAGGQVPGDQGLDPLAQDVVDAQLHPAALRHRELDGGPAPERVGIGRSQGEHRAQDLRPSAGDPGDHGHPGGPAPLDEYPGDGGVHRVGFEQVQVVETRLQPGQHVGPDLAGDLGVPGLPVPQGGGRHPGQAAAGVAAADAGYGPGAVGPVGGVSDVAVRGLAAEDPESQRVAGRPAMVGHGLGCLGLQGPVVAPLVVCRGTALVAVGVQSAHQVDAVAYPGAIGIGRAPGGGGPG